MQYRSQWENPEADSPKERGDYVVVQFTEDDITGKVIARIERDNSKARIAVTVARGVHIANALNSYEHTKLARRQPSGRLTR